MRLVGNRQKSVLHVYLAFICTYGAKMWMKMQPTKKKKSTAFMANVPLKRMCGIKQIARIHMRSVFKLDNIKILWISCAKKNKCAHSLDFFRFLFAKIEVPFALICLMVILRLKKVKTFYRSFLSHRQAHNCFHRSQPFNSISSCTFLRINISKNLNVARKRNTRKYVLYTHSKHEERRRRQRSSYM